LWYGEAVCRVREGVKPGEWVHIRNLLVEEV